MEKISPPELGEALIRLGHEKSTAITDAEKMVRELDCDGDGLIDLDEFINVVDVVNDDLVNAFCVFDYDKNGFISSEELHKVLVSLGFSKCSLGDCHRMIKGVDKDGDGFVSFEEFKLMMAGGCVG